MQPYFLQHLINYFSRLILLYQFQDHHLRNFVHSDFAVLHSYLDGGDDSWGTQENVDEISWVDSGSAPQHIHNKTQTKDSFVDENGSGTCGFGAVWVWFISLTGLTGSLDFSTAAFISSTFNATVLMTMMMML